MAAIRSPSLHLRRLRQILGVIVVALGVVALMDALRGRFLLTGINTLLMALLLWARWRVGQQLNERIIGVVVAILMGGLCVLIANDQGLYDEGILAYPALLIFTGMYGSRRLLFGLTALMAVFMGALFWLDLGGTLPSAPLALSPVRPITITLILVVVAFFISILASDLRRTMQALEVEKQALEESNERIAVLAHHDSLTGLPNRMLAMDRLDRLLHLARRDARLLAVLFLDLDNFKTINDSLGHAAGDALLVQVATRLEASVRDSDTVARISGDEFLILLGHVEREEDLAPTATRIMQALEPSFTLDGLDVTVTASVGIAIAPRDGAECDTLFKHADLAMYRAKGAGRNAFRFFDASMNENAMEQLRIASGLRAALAVGELQVHYQPQFELDSGRVVGAEALLRWQHPELGNVPPDRFIPVAERSGLIHELGRWVLQQACRDAAAWRRSGIGDVNVAVNVSALQFHRNHLERDVADALAASGMPAHGLTLEITESLLVADAANLRGILQRLADSGVKIAIDDFGTGYSNLGYLRRFAIQRLKVDRSFVLQMASNSHDEGLVRAIIEMGHCLGMQVIAEGVESLAILERLQAFGCEYGQGLHWSPAMPASAFGTYLRSHPDARPSGFTSLH